MERIVYLIQINLMINLADAGDIYMLLGVCVCVCVRLRRAGSFGLYYRMDINNRLQGKNETKR